MFCPNCGTPNADTSRFCMKCGSALPTITIPNQPVTPLQPGVPAPARSRSGLWLGLLVLAALAVVTFTVFYVGNQNGWFNSAPPVVAPNNVAANSAPPTVPTATQTPLPSAAPPAQQATGRICVQAFEDKDGNGLHAEVEEPLLSGISFTLRDDSSDVKGSYSTDGSSEPYCFSNLSAGQYTIQARAPNKNGTVTTPGQWVIPLASSARFEVAYGLKTSVTPTPLPTPCPDLSPYNLSQSQLKRLGCPGQGFVADRQVIIQRFQKGVMVIFAKPNNTFDNKGGAFIYALANDGRVWRMVDTYIETSPNRPAWYSCDVKSNDGPEVTGVPWRGFGKAWCTYPDVKATLGKALSGEEGNLTASFQSYETGRAFKVSDWRGFPGWSKNRVYLIYLPTAEGDYIAGTWEAQ